MKTCPICGTKFAKPEWPVTRKIYCSSNCTNKAWKLRNPDYNWSKLNPKKSRKIKRRWNWSSKGKAYKKAWYQSHKDEMNKKPISKRRRKETSSRNTARKKLLRNESIRKCVKCGSNKFVNCHHIDFNPFNNNLLNLEWLCKKCHTDKHYEHNLENITNPSMS